MCVDAAFCPLCDNEMHITNAGFHDCAWRILGVKKNGEHKLNVKTIARQVCPDKEQLTMFSRRETSTSVVTHQSVGPQGNG